MKENHFLIHRAQMYVCMYVCMYASVTRSNRSKSNNARTLEVILLWSSELYCQNKTYINVYETWPILIVQTYEQYSTYELNIHICVCVCVCRCVYMWVTTRLFALLTLPTPKYTTTHFWLLNWQYVSLSGICISNFSHNIQVCRINPNNIRQNSNVNKHHTTWRVRERLDATDSKYLCQWMVDWSVGRSVNSANTPSAQLVLLTGFLFSDNNMWTKT